MKRLLGLLLGAGLAVPALAIEYRTVNIATVLYDAPSLRGSKLFVIRRGTPVELVVNLEGWSKVRDADGGLAWIEAAALVKRRSVIVTVARAQVRRISFGLHLRRIGCVPFTANWRSSFCLTLSKQLKAKTHLARSDSSCSV